VVKRKKISRLVIASLVDEFPPEQLLIIISFQIYISVLFVAHSEKTKLTAFLWDKVSQLSDQNLALQQLFLKTRDPLLLLKAVKVETLDLCLEICDFLNIDSLRLSILVDRGGQEELLLKDLNLLSQLVGLHCFQISVNHDFVFDVPCPVGIVQG
jgi:hypothetical protein